ncbi:MAG: hypothetical protein OXT67_11685 [Zetaproteobacteria bacterium]|nr:hypothetical protein [Zetaproteobacteria bacterium]
MNTSPQSLRIALTCSLAWLSLPVQAKPISWLSSHLRPAGVAALPVDAPHPLTEPQQQLILHQFLHPTTEPQCADKLSFLPLLRSHHDGHYQRIGYFGLTHQRLTGFASLVHDLGGFRASAGKSRLQTDDTMAFYLYLSLLTCLRDLDLDSVEGFKPEEHDDLLHGWSWAGNVGPASDTADYDSKSILAHLHAHRREYLHLLAFRFVQQNKSLQHWHKKFTPQGKSIRLGTYQDSWDKARHELDQFYRKAKSSQFIEVVRKLLKGDLGIYDATKAAAAIAELERLRDAHGFASGTTKFWKMPPLDNKG